MLTKKKPCLALAAILAAPIAFGGGHDACLNCHAPAEEFNGMSAQEISTAIKDAGIRPHRRFADRSDEEVQAIADALSSQ